MLAWYFQNYSMTPKNFLRHGLFWSMRKKNEGDINNAMTLKEML